MSYQEQSYIVSYRLAVWKYVSNNDEGTVQLKITFVMNNDLLNQAHGLQALCALCFLKLL